MYGAIFCKRSLLLGRPARPGLSIYLSTGWSGQQAMVGGSACTLVVSYAEISASMRVRTTTRVQKDEHRAFADTKGEPRMESSAWTARSLGVSRLLKYSVYSRIACMRLLNVRCERNTTEPEWLTRSSSTSNVDRELPSAIADDGIIDPCSFS